MQIPLEINFHHADHPDWAEGAIREHVEKLERYYKRLVSCRVHVDTRSGKGSIPPSVRIDLGVANHKHLVVTHDGEQLAQKAQSPDLRRAITEAFRIAEQRLRDYGKELRDRSTEGTPAPDPGAA